MATSLSAEAPLVPGWDRIVREAGRRRIEVHDLYDEVGAEYYHDFAVHDQHEIREIITVLRRHPGDVLELAAGSGRLTLPLLKSGRDVTALELSRDMLAILDERLATMPARVAGRCHPVAADMTAFDLGRTFPVVLVGTTSVSLLDAAGRAGMFRSIRRHLTPDGVLVLTTIHSDPDSRSAETTDVVGGRTGLPYRIHHRHVPGAASRQIAAVRLDADADPVVVCVSDIGILEPDLLRREMTAAGLEVREQHAVPGAGPGLVETMLVAGLAS